MTSSSLADKTCVPCTGKVPCLSDDASKDLLQQLPGWELAERRIHKTYKFGDFVQALAFVNRIGAIAESEQHHPDIHLAWGKVRVETWTHTANGLTENDFILAAKIDQAN